REVILELQGHPRFRVLPSMRFEYFLTLLKHAQVLVGNSSSGVREAPVYGVPSVNIGTRQLNRYRYPSILDVPEDEAAILVALENLPCAVPPSFTLAAARAPGCSSTCCAAQACGAPSGRSSSATCPGGATRARSHTRASPSLLEWRRDRPRRAAPGGAPSARVEAGRARRGDISLRAAPLRIS